MRKYDLFQISDNSKVIQQDEQIRYLEDLNIKTSNLSINTWNWLKTLSDSYNKNSSQNSQEHQIELVVNLKVLSGFGHSNDGIHYLTGQVVMFIVIILILVNAYFVYRIYYQRKYLSVYWIKQYGKSQLENADNQLSIDLDQQKETQRALNLGEVEVQIEEEGYQNNEIQQQQIDEVDEINEYDSEEMPKEQTSQSNYTRSINYQTEDQIVNKSVIRVDFQKQEKKDLSLKKQMSDQRNSILSPASIKFEIKNHQEQILDQSSILQEEEDFCEDQESEEYEDKQNQNKSVSQNKSEEISQNISTNQLAQKQAQIYMNISSAHEFLNQQQISKNHEKLSQGAQISQNISRGQANSSQALQNISQKKNQDRLSYVSQNVSQKKGIDKSKSKQKHDQFQQEKQEEVEYEEYYDEEQEEELTTYGNNLSQKDYQTKTNNQK